MCDSPRMLPGSTTTHEHRMDKAPLTASPAQAPAGQVTG